MSNTCILKKMTSPYKISLYKNGDAPNIYYYFRWHKKKYQGSTSCESLAAAENKASEIYFEITKGLRQKGRQKNITLDDVINKFLEFKINNDLASKSLVEYKRQSKYLIERFKERDLESLCSKAIYSDYSNWRRNYYLIHEKKRQTTYKRKGKILKGRLRDHVGNVSINRECRLLVSILRFSKEHLGHLKNIEIPSYKILPEQRREEILTKDEYQKLKDYWLKKNPYYWQIISFVNNSGIRYPSELNRICYKDVHLDRSYVLIRDRKNKNKSEPVNTPVPLVGRAKEIIEALISRDNISKNADDPVFVTSNNVQIKNISHGFKKSLEKCDIKKNLTMYSLRHLFTTRMVRRPDISIKILSDVLGHKDTTMIDKRYSHLRAEDYVHVFQQSEEHKQEALKKQNQNHEK